MLGASLAASALLLLCGCEGKPVEAGDVHIPPSLAPRFYPPEGWAWGRLEVFGAPALRYGVAVPLRAVKAEVLILPGAGEPVEAWFETANDLVAQGYGVWALDWTGQGGSARWGGASDRLYALSLDPDVAALKAMVAKVVRPRSRAPLILIADGLGAQLALRALADGLPDVEGAVLGSPALAPRPTNLVEPFGSWGAELAGKVGFGRPFVAGEHSWKAAERTSRDRAGAAMVWMQSNPSLRIGGASLAWTAAYNRSAAAARDPAALGRTKAPVLLVAETKDGGARNACFALKGCRFVVLAAAGPPHLATDFARSQWLAETASFIDVHSRDHLVAAPPARAP